MNIIAIRTAYVFMVLSKNPESALAQGFQIIWPNMLIC